MSADMTRRVVEQWLNGAATYDVSRYGRVKGMQHRLREVLAIGVTTVAVSLGTFSGAEAAALPSPSGTRTCYAQLDHDAFASIISQNFEPALDMYDSQAADDFVLTKPCRRPVLFIGGSYGEGQGSADSFNVTIYLAGKHGPGKVVRQLEALPFTEPCGQGRGCTQIVLTKKLQPGHWWLSVQANLDFSQTGEQWSWGTNETVRRSGAMWKNADDGFGTG